MTEVRHGELEIEYVDDEASTSVIVVGFDPGVTTGWCVLRIPALVLMEQGFREASRDPRFGMATGQVYCEEPWGGSKHPNLDPMVDDMIDITREAYVLGDYSPPLNDRFIVAMEGFSLRMMDSAWHTLAPVRVFEKYERWRWEVRDRLRFAYFKNSSSDAMNIVTDARLRAWNLYAPGTLHARDAQRQAILTARKWASEASFRKYVDDSSSSERER